MTTMDWLIVAVAALVVAYAIYQRFFAGYRPLLRKALKQWQLGNRDAAHDSFQLLVPRLKGRFALRDLATVRLYLAAFFWERGLPRAMAEQARRALDESLVRGKLWQQVIAELAFGVALVEMARWEEARRPLEAAEAQSQAQGRKRVRMYIRTGLGWVHLGIGNRQLATDYAKAANAEVRDHPEWAREHPALLLLLGRLCHALGLWDDALAHFDEVQATVTAPSQRPLKVEALLMHGMIDAERGNLAAGYEVLQEALRLVAREQPATAARIHLTLAKLYRNVGQTGEARLSVEQARGLAGKAADQDLEREVALAVATQHRLQGRYQEARELLTRALVDALAEDPGPELAQVLIGWGELLLELGDDREAYAHFRLAERIRQGFGGTLWDIELPYRLALLHHRMGLLDRGSKYEQEGDHLRRKLGITRRPTVLRKAG